MGKTMTDKPASAGKPAPIRILAGLGPVVDEIRTIEAALALAQALKAEITGHFVEESSLYDLAALPFAKALRPMGRQALPIEQLDMEREIAHAAANWRQTLGVRANRSSVTCTFRTTRGEYCAEIAKAATTTDIVVINPANIAGAGRRAVAAVLSAFKGTAATVLLPDRSSAVAHGPVVLLAGAADPELETFRLAGRIASKRGARLIVLTNAALKPLLEAQQTNAPEEFESRILLQPGSGVSGTALAIAAMRPSFVIVSADRGHLSEPDVEILLRAAGAPLMLIAPADRPS